MSPSTAPDCVGRASFTVGTTVLDRDWLGRLDAGTARDFAATVASGTTKMIGMMNSEMRRNLRHDLDRALAFELSLLDTPVEDRAEGARSFAERRPPVFSGR